MSDTSSPDVPTTNTLSNPAVIAIGKSYFPMVGEYVRIKDNTFYAVSAAVNSVDDNHLILLGVCKLEVLNLVDYLIDHIAIYCTANTDKQFIVKQIVTDW